VCRRGVHLIAAQRACNGTRHKQLHMTSRAVACAASRFSSARTRSDSHWARLTDSKIVALFLRKAMYGGQGAGSACASSADTAAEASAHQPWASPQRSAPSAARAPLPAPPALRQCVRWSNHGLWKEYESRLSQNAVQEIVLRCQGALKPSAHRRPAPALPQRRRDSGLRTLLGASA